MADHQTGPYHVRPMTNLNRRWDLMADLSLTCLLVPETLLLLILKLNSPMTSWPMSIQPKRFNFRIRGRGRVLRTSKQVSDKTTAWFQHMLMPAQTICVPGGSNTHILCHPTTNLNRAWGYVPDQHAYSLDITRWHTSTEERSRLHARSSHWSLVCHPMTHLNRRSHCPLR
jgi:hypothetical protein